MYRKASVSDTTLKSRKRQRQCYVNICTKFKWNIYWCSTAQACKYVTFLAGKMRYFSVMNYYQTVIFYHNIKGLRVTGWSDPIFAQTIKGIKKLESVPEDVKDPLSETNMEVMFKNVSVKIELDFLLWIVIVFFFRTLLG